MVFRPYVGAVFVVAIGLAGPIACLLITWLFLPATGPLKTLRERFPIIAFRFACLSLVLAFAFLVRLYLRSSVFNHPEPYWMPLNWLSALCWLSVCILVFVIKGKSRLALAIWCITLPVFVGMMYVGAYAY